MGTITKKFTRTYLIDDLDLPRRPGTEHAGCTVIADAITDNGRWTIYHDLIFRLADQPPGEAWRVSYGVGATESQDESPWDHEPEVTATLVRQVEKVVRVWVDADTPPSGTVVTPGTAPEADEPAIAFTFEGRTYETSMAFYHRDRVRLPDGRALHAKGGWYETMPPTPGRLEVCPDKDPTIPPARLTAG
jgi:hypothetical protein